jgi:hypothetical protein
MGKVRSIALAIVLMAVVIGIAALLQAGGWSLPWWGWALVGWTGLSFVVGRLIGLWLKSVQLTADELAWVADSSAGDPVRGTQDLAAIEEPITASALGAMEDAVAQRLGEDKVQIASLA